MSRAISTDGVCAAQLFRRGDALPEWLWALVERVQAAAPLMEGRTIAQSLSALASLGIVEFVAPGPSEWGDAVADPLPDRAEIARIRMARLGGSERGGGETEGTGEGGAERPAAAAGDAALSRAGGDGDQAAAGGGGGLEAPALSDAEACQTGDEMVEMMDDVTSATMGDGCGPRGKQGGPHADETRQQQPGVAARKLRHPVVGALCERGAQAQVNHTFSGAILCEALGALGQMRQPRDNSLVIALCARLAAADKAMLRDVPSKTLVELMHSLSLLRPPAAPTPTLAMSLDTHPALASADTAAATPGKATTQQQSEQTWKQALDRVAEALCAPSKMEALSGRQLAAAAVALAALAHRHQFVLLRISGRAMARQVLEGMGGASSDCCGLQEGERAGMRTPVGAVLERIGCFLARSTSS